jgi:hypothetical protein
MCRDPHPYLVFVDLAKEVQIHSLVLSSDQSKLNLSHPNLTLMMKGDELTNTPESAPSPHDPCSDLIKHYYQLFLYQGLGTGIGAGCLYVPALAIQAHHWRERRVLVMGIVVTGASESVESSSPSCLTSSSI